MNNTNKNENNVHEQMGGGNKKNDCFVDIDRIKHGDGNSGKDCHTSISSDGCNSNAAICSSSSGTDRNAANISSSNNNDVNSNIIQKSETDNRNAANTSSSNNNNHSGSDDMIQKSETDNQSNSSQNNKRCTQISEIVNDGTMLMIMAGLHDEWIDSNGRLQKTFTIMTQEACKGMLKQCAAYCI